MQKTQGNGPEGELEMQKGQKQSRDWGVETEKGENVNEDVITCWEEVEIRETSVFGN